MNNYFCKGRLRFIFLLIAIFATYVFVFYVKLSLTTTGKVENRRTVVQRGSILDRNGHPLAVQTNFYNLKVSPNNIPSGDIMEQFAKDIAPFLGVSYDTIIATIKGSRNPKFVNVARKITQTQHDDIERIINQKVKGYSRFAGFDTIPGRFYPESALASQVIGYMGDDGVGLSGVELSQEEYLCPPTKNSALRVLSGQNIYLTIDANLQYKLEKIATDAMENTKAESIMLLALEAKTGEILSYISLPSANLNNYGMATISERIDRIASTNYEPGSVFKIFSVATFLDAGVIKDSDSFFCDGHYDRKLPSGELIRINCLEHHGWVTAREALKYSCNDALAQMSDKITSQGFLQGLKALGFGQRTDIELPGEAYGIIKDTDSKSWSARTKATMSIGQEISVTALQMLEATTAICNSGSPLNLTVISKRTDRNGNVLYQHSPAIKQQVLSTRTCRNIISYMETTAKTGTGARAALGDISIGVKTGTAQIADTVHGGYSDTDFLSNCIAVFPTEDPKIILYIVIQKAQGETYAGRIVAPVIAEAANVIIDHLGITRENATSFTHTGKIYVPPRTPIVVKDTVPNFLGLSKKDLLPLLDRKDFCLLLNGDGRVIRQTPQVGTSITQGMTIELDLE